jgi:uncharacterized protein YjbI with pentapeptide repeats
VGQEKKATGKQSWGNRLWARTGFGDKTIWDWLQLLIVPLVLGVIGFYFTTSQEYAHQQELEARRAKAERALEEERLQNAILQTYLAGMRELLLDKNLRASEEGSDIRAVARAQTRSTMGQLSPEGKGIAIQFLYEASLIDKENPVVSLSAVRLRGADLSDVELQDANLSGTYLNDADLSGTSLNDTNLIGAHLSSANLSWATLSSAEVSGAYLIGANLSNAHLSNANLRGTHLMEANLSDAILRDAHMGDGVELNDANLSNADLVGANLSGAYLIDTNLSGAYLFDTNLKDTNLSGANLSGATGVTEEQLEEQAKLLEGATMPDGSKHP